MSNSQNGAPSKSSKLKSSDSGMSEEKRSFKLFIPGRPKSQGSKRPIKTKSGAMRIVEQVKGLEAWRQDIKRWSAETGFPMWSRTEAIILRLDFHFLRPASISQKKRPHVTVYPDLDKLCRATFDALTGILWADDAQVIEVTATKTYGEREGVLVHAKAR